MNKQLTDTNTPVGSGQTSAQNSPAMGDNASKRVWAMLVAASAVVIVALIFKRNLQHKKEEE